MFSLISLGPYIVTVNILHESRTGDLLITTLIHLYLQVMEIHDAAVNLFMRTL